MNLPGLFAFSATSGGAPHSPDEKLSSRRRIRRCGRVATNYWRFAVNIPRFNLMPKGGTMADRPRRDHASATVIFVGAMLLLSLVATRLPAADDPFVSARRAMIADIRASPRPAALSAAARASRTRR